ncbi:hypothetical protein E2562_015431 [Oryza meyeriana var. granulata]|uniref:Uncharacterized protein n=1 Tax=Oryza meyeriana var. granulata TaxID=110450 RepID=A0A6G1BWX3_9ORYZ|nr:hypothetical protein E2562_015431 [Oryza meyeriana var. granulata]
MKDALEPCSSGSPRQRVVHCCSAPTPVVGRALPRYRYTGSRDDGAGPRCGLNGRSSGMGVAPQWRWRTHRRGWSMRGAVAVENAPQQHGPVKPED